MDSGVKVNEGTRDYSNVNFYLAKKYKGNENALVGRTSIAS